MRRFIKALLATLVIATSCKDDKNKITVVDDETFIADEENEKLKLVFKKAQNSLDHFINEFNLHANDTAYWFSAKTRFEHTNGINHIWLKVVDYRKDGVFIGILHNEVDWSDSFKIGDTIYVNRKKIEDWYIENENTKKVQGDFTERILFENN